MMLLLSPAKALDFSPSDGSPIQTMPQFLNEAEILVRILQTYSVPELAQLMGLSDKLAILNVGRYATWKPQHSAENSKAAILAFNGDVYEGLSAKEWTAEQLIFAQQHLRILSGLYGLLRPLDWIQPYRLEMGTGLVNPKGKNLYAYWQSHVTKALCQHVESHRLTAVVNLASEEYFKVVDANQLGVPVVQPVFQEFRSGHYKVISFLAKRARGLMARYAVEQRITDVHALKNFTVEGYQYVADLSTANKWVFRRSVSD